ncbi:MAG: hypothetical protein OIF47_06450 [Marinibacterium sp.]|nr:hypothetical protein [Marinibacterium sp.]
MVTPDDPKPKMPLVFRLTLIWALLGLGGVLIFLIRATGPDEGTQQQMERARNHLFTSIEGIAPGEARWIDLKHTIVIVWRRDATEQSLALQQAGLIEPGGVSAAPGSGATDENTALPFDPEWLFVGAVSPNSPGCVVMPKAGRFGGFFDPCTKAHFDMWGRLRDGPGDRDLVILPSRIDGAAASVFLDLTDVPKAR